MVLLSSLSTAAAAANASATVGTRGPSFFICSPVITDSACCRDVVALVVDVLWTAGVVAVFLWFAEESFSGSVLDISLGLSSVTTANMELAMISLATPFFDAPLG